MKFRDKKNLREESIPLGYVEGKLYTELTLDNRVLRATIVELKGQLDECGRRKTHVIEDDILKIREATKAYDTLLDAYRELIQERDRLLTDKERLESECKENIWDTFQRELSDLRCGVEKLMKACVIIAEENKRLKEEIKRSRKLKNE